MIFQTLLILFISILFLYFTYTSYFFQLFIHKHKIKKKFLEDFKGKVRGNFQKEGYFGTSHKIISKKEYKALSNKQKPNFSKCYNIIRFKTADIEWELYYNLLKEGIGFQEILNIRVFPRFLKIKSEGNVEKNYGRLNVFTNNSYLTHILETDTTDYLKWLLRYDGDMLLISHNNLHFKAFKSSNKLGVARSMDIVKSLNGIKRSIYRKDVIEY